VFLTGEGGVGKSRLLNETVQEAQRRGIPTLVGRASVGVPVTTPRALLPAVWR